MYGENVCLLQTTPSKAVILKSKHGDMAVVNNKFIRECLIYEPGHSISYMIVCAPSEDRSACASAQSDLSLRCPPEDALDHWRPTECPERLIRPRGCAGCPESSLGAHAILQVHWLIYSNFVT